MQAMGENADALEAAGLDVRLNQPEQEPILFADSQKTWRIIDNLISNVKNMRWPAQGFILRLAKKTALAFLQSRMCPGNRLMFQ